MKKFFLIIILLISFCFDKAQVFYTENFNNGCTANCLLTAYGGWTVTNNAGGTSGSSPNVWYVSCAEEGIAPPGCGSSCIGDACLHIGANAGGGGDQGATFNETGAVNATYRRAVSPSISTLGRSNIVLQFDYIAFGSAACADDRAQLQLSDNNGVTWPVGYQFCLTTPCCGACNGYSQGQWTTYTYTLPAAFNNNAGIRVGFHWRNNGNGSGTDPSVAIDDIQLRQISPLPLNLLDFSASKQVNANKLIWKSADELNFSHFEIERAEDAINFTKIARVNGKGNGQGVANYYQEDKSIFKDQIYYYRLKMVDSDGSFNYSKIISVNGVIVTNTELQLVSSLVYENKLKLEILSGKANTIRLTAFDVKGKMVLPSKDLSLRAGTNSVSLDLNDLNPAMYLLKINQMELGTSEIPVITQKFVKTE